MRTILRQSNLDLCRECERLEEVLHSVAAALPEELLPLHNWVTQQCLLLRDQAREHLSQLALETVSILPDLLSQTQSLMRSFHIFNQRLVGPVLRARVSDRLSLKLLTWLHAVHPQTAHIPVGLRDEEFSVWPVPQLPTVYALPPAAQHGLLYLPLFFHEFAHLLYASHLREMSELVKSLQRAIADALEPTAQRNDRHAEVADATRSTVVETWFEWTQELFCDAVGLIIGGPAFANAFSLYTRMLGRGEYHIPADDLRHRPHPVTWLRAQLLADHARRLGFASVANGLEQDWGRIARVLGIEEEYYGYYDPTFLPAIRRTIDDMLMEAAPRQFSAAEIAPHSGAPEQLRTPIALLNMAWHEFERAPDDYNAWEERAIEAFVTGDLVSHTVQ